MQKPAVRKPYCRVTPTQHAAFLQLVSSQNFKLPEVTDDTHQSFDRFYDVVLGILNKFYPVRYVTVTSRDPAFITPQVKAMLRRKNRLMRAGREEEAGALALHIGKTTKRHAITYYKIFCNACSSIVLHMRSSTTTYIYITFLYFSFGPPALKGSKLQYRFPYSRQF